MKLLLDTHTFIWWDSDPIRLSSTLSHFDAAWFMRLPNITFRQGFAGNQRGVVASWPPAQFIGRTIRKEQAHSRRREA